jgi:hypothetical protein
MSLNQTLLNEINQLKAQITALKEYRNPVNYIINGNMDFWQRGTSFSAPEGVYTADRLRTSGNAGAINISRSTDIPFDRFYSSLRYSAKIKCATAHTSIATGDYRMIDHRIEGFPFANLKMKIAVFSFWIKSNKTGSLGLSFVNHDASRSYVHHINIDQINTWERKVIPIHFDVSYGSWYYDHRVGLDIRFCLSSGTNLQTGNQREWVSSNSLSTSTQTNFLDSTDNEVFITGLQLIEGRKDIPITTRSYQEELQLCQRYYEKSYDINDPPGDYPNWNGPSMTIIPADASHIYGLHQPFKGIKRTKPSITWYDPYTGTKDAVAYYSGSWQSQSVNISGNRTGETHTGYPSLTAAISANINIQAHWTAEAEL